VTPELQPSNGLRRAAGHERERIRRAQGRLAERRASLQEELARIEREIESLEQRATLLDQLTGEEGALLVGAGASIAAGEGGPRTLRGRPLREQAARLLYLRHGAGQLVHYRQWFDELLAEGWDISGKDPLASFLTNVTRAPLVERGEAPGTYQLDLSRADAYRQRLAEQQAELRDLMTLLSQEVNPAEHLREHRTRLLASVRHLEAAVAEIERVLAPEEDEGRVPDVQARAA
jgi:hypothetical protein